jgi:hypothetical protein
MIIHSLEKHEKFFDPIKRLNLKALSELAKKTTIKSSQNKIIEYRQQSNIALMKPTIASATFTTFSINIFY